MGSDDTRRSSGCESSVCFRVPSLRSPKGNQRGRARGFVLLAWPAWVGFGGAQLCLHRRYKLGRHTDRTDSEVQWLGKAELRLKAEADQMICQSSQW